MKELTMLTTCEITFIGTVSDEEAFAMMKTRPRIENIIRELIDLGVTKDNVNILKHQFFIRDIPNSSEEVVGTAVQGA